MLLKAPLAGGRRALLWVTVQTSSCHEWPPCALNRNNKTPTGKKAVLRMKTDVLVYLRPGFVSQPNM